MPNTPGPRSIESPDVASTPAPAGRAQMSLLAPGRPGAGIARIRKRGREKQYFENLRLSLRLGTMEALAKVTRPGECRVDIIREAIDREISRREALPAEEPGRT